MTPHADATDSAGISSYSTVSGSSTLTPLENSLSMDVADLGSKLDGDLAPFSAFITHFVVCVEIWDLNCLTANRITINTATCVRGYKEVF